MRGRSLSIPAAIVAALATLGCGSGPTALAPTQAPNRPSALGGAPQGAAAAGAATPDFGSCLRGTGASCFTAGTGDSSPEPLIRDVGRCLQAAPVPGCVDAVRVRPASVAVGAASPTGLSYSATGSSVTLTWTAPPPSDVVLSYIIEAGSASGLSNLASFSTGSTATSFTASGVPTGTYFVRVRGATINGPTTPSNEVVVVVGDGPCSVPPGPPGLSVTSNRDGIVSLAWSPGIGGTSSYILEAGSSSGLANLLNADQGQTTTLTATGVAIGTYYVRVRGRNACGIGGASNEVVVVVGAQDVEYRVTGTAGRVFVTYVDSTGGTAQTFATLPWSYAWSGARPGDFLFVSAQQQVTNGIVVVSIYRNGVLYKTSTAEGANAIALASGTY